MNYSTVAPRLLRSKPGNARHGRRLRAARCRLNFGLTGVNCRPITTYISFLQMHDCILKVSSGSGSRQVLTGRCVVVRNWMWVQACPVLTISRIPAFHWNRWSIRLPRDRSLSSPSQEEQQHVTPGCVGWDCAKVGSKSFPSCHLAELPVLRAGTRAAIRWVSRSAHPFSKRRWLFHPRRRREHQFPLPFLLLLIRR